MLNRTQLDIENLIADLSCIPLDKISELLIRDGLFASIVHNTTAESLLLARHMLELCAGLLIEFREDALYGGNKHLVSSGIEQREPILYGYNLGVEGWFWNCSL